MLLCVCAAAVASAQELVMPWGADEPGPVQSAARHARTPELVWDTPLAPGAQRAASRHYIAFYSAYGIAGGSGDYACNMVDFDLEYGYRLHPRHALTLSLNVGFGDKMDNRWVLDAEGAGRAYSNNFSRTMLGLMLGYRFSQPLGRVCRLHMGAMAGLDMQRLRSDIGRDWHQDDEYEDVWDSETETYVTTRRRHGRGDTAWGLAYAGYAAIEWQVGDEVSLTLGYMYRGTTAAPRGKADYPPGEPARRADAGGWHELRLGISRAF